jgi:uroporphyrin-III C-methyltransferase/precorrin-2 dehydrogenase/sirohydrochlorin ferrochelatase
MSTANQTVVIYMGLMKAAHIQQQLISAGRSPTTPVAIIENGTRLDQRIIITELSTLAGQVSSQQVQSPALLIIGEVVSLQRQLHWFGARPQVPVFAQPLTQLR